jgi:cyclopropane-fatty-acyl-phospholipid synthase
MGVADVINTLAALIGSVLVLVVLGKVLLKKYLSASARSLMLGLLSQAGIEVGRGKDIMVHDDSIWFDWMANGMLAIGESYMAGQWEAIAPLDQVLHKLMNMSSAQKRTMFKSWNSRFVALAGRVFNYQSVERAGIVGSFHYDLGNDFYSLWLDSHLQYSCGYWKDASSLEECQQHKMKLICDKLHLEPGMTVLDIGCGWGGLACFLAKTYGCHVTGITISNEQLKGARRRAAVDGVTELTSFEYCDYRGIHKEFDRVVSVAMMEAVGYKNIDEYLRIVKDCTKMGGLALVHTIGANRSTKTAHQRWITRYIFPNGFLPSLMQICQFAERKMVVEDVQNIGPDYEKTLMAWNAEFQEHVSSGKIERPLMFIKMWEFYLQYCAAGFRARTIQLYQVVLSKHRPGRYDAPR